MTESEQGDTTTENIPRQGGQWEEKTEPLKLPVPDLVPPPGKIKVDENGTLIYPPERS